MKNYLNKIFAGGIVALALSACTGDYENINGNPYQPDNLAPDNYLLTSAMTNIFGRVIPADVNMCQFTDCLMGGTLGGYMADGNPNFKNNSFVGGYAPNGWSRVFLEANNNSIIPTIYTNLAIVEGFAERSGRVAPVAIANLAKIASMNRVADCYGPVPYTNIGYDGNILTPYDSQQDVYNAFFNDLETCRQQLVEAIANGETVSANIDRVFRGDLNKWLKFANSLQLRFAMRLSYANPNLARQMAEAAVNPANGGVMESAAETARYDGFTMGGNPIYGATVNYGNDSRPAADVICYMNGYNDPRRAKFFTQSNWKNADGTYMTGPDGISAEYCGVRRGWDTYARDGWALNMSQIAVQTTDPVLWMSASEVCFLRAEGAAVFGWNMGGNAETFYNKGIEISFDECGATGAADYIADATSVPARFYDPSGANPWNGSLPAVTIKWDDSATAEQKQERIIVQKWIANCYLGNEAWADIRRTGYPKLIPVAYYNPTVVTATVGPQRMPYPQEEYTNNGANVNQAVQQYLGGPDNMATKLWWACKPEL